MGKIHCPKENCNNLVDDSWKYCFECGYNLTALFSNENKMFELAQKLEKNGNDIDAVYFLIRCSKLGNPNAMFRLGLHYENGKGVEQSFKRTKYCMEEAAKKKQIDAICWIAAACEYGKGTIEINLAEALNWYQIAFDLGNKEVKDKISELKESITSIDDSLVEEPYEDNKYDNSEEESTFTIDDLNIEHKVELLQGSIIKKEFAKPKKISGPEQIFEEETQNLSCIIGKINAGIQKLRTGKIDLYGWSCHDEDDFGQFNDAKSYNNYIAREIKRLELSADSPYVARMCLLDHEKKEIDIYVGRQALDVNGETLVYSWNSPLGNKIYDKVNTNYSIQVKDKNGKNYITNYSLQTRRKMDIQKRKLIKVVQEFSVGSEVGSMIFDEFLQHILEKKKHDQRLTDIIPSIQNNQNQIITRPLSENLIVQGCAGSGKTMILLHRLAYLKTNTSIDYATVKILTPSENFNMHIDSLWRELKLHTVSKSTVTQYYIDKLIQYDSKWKSQLDVRELLDDKDLPCEVVEYYYSEKFIEDVNEVWEILAEDYKEKCNQLKKNYYEKRMPDWELRKESYDSLPESKRSNQPPAKPKLSFPLINVLGDIFSEIKPKYNSIGKIHRCELYASLFMTFKMLGPKSSEKFLCIDEGQDISKAEYLLMRSINGNNVIFNIYGDTNQLIDKNKGIADWKELNQVGLFAEYELNENYRNTTEITKFTNQTFGCNMNPLGIDGNKVMQINTETLLTKLINESEQDRIAVIYKSGNLIDNPQQLLSLIESRKNISLLTVEQAKGIEFDTVYVFIEGMTQNEKYIALTRALSFLYVVNKKTVVFP